ncbi:MAG: nucleotide pyrophosphohydrolase [Patescibacteria group bacterium]|nr:nucleotide pyrophosphohydrolase [Patescibacteria group bacterium]MDE1944343.1 nucleotide pyrophosphohydrolase [Patescibacteria group bacterium]MDE1945337.1 nucleotide pyrophosphohydrolase [Patescibacteria group bacterium]MDE2057693.1 nucleotide pyrophosphohydrolase [Patescibacteria group bacterium]
MHELEAEIRTHLEERGWDQLRPGDLAKSIAIEAAELLELFQWSNPTLAEVKEDAEKVEEVKKELADVLIYCLDLAVSLRLDAAAIIRAKLKKAQEKYPAHLFKNSGAEPGTEEAYWRIKEEYRKAGK